MTDLTMDGITKDCPIECLAPLLSVPTFSALVAGVEDSATVGQVVALYEQGKLMKIYNISSGRLGEIRRCLAEAGLIDPRSEPLSGLRGISKAPAQCRHEPACPQILSQLTI